MDAHGFVTARQEGSATVLTCRACQQQAGCPDLNSFQTFLRTHIHPERWDGTA